MKILNAVGAIEIGKGKHRKFLLPNNMKFILSRTPSDRRSSLNSLMDLRKMLGNYKPA